MEKSTNKSTACRINGKGLRKHTSWPKKLHMVHVLNTLVIRTVALMDHVGVVFVLKEEIQTTASCPSALNAMPSTLTILS